MTKIKPQLLLAFASISPNELPPEFTRGSFGEQSEPRRRGHFTVNTYREPVRRMMIDNVPSELCACSVVDGSWMYVNPSCQDDVRYTMVSSPSDYITVRIDTMSESAPGMAVQRAPHSRDSMTKQ